MERDSGSASVEQVALAALVALVLLAAIAAVAARPPGDGARLLGNSIARRIACAPRHPVPCGRNPLALAYGFPVGKLVRLLAPAPGSLSPEGLLPVDFRLCRSPGCAAPGDGPGLTAAGRRVTVFTSVEDLRRAGGPVRISYWLYRPTRGWERLVRDAGAAELARAAGLRLNLELDPALVPLETLAGRNHHRFAPGEQPPWRWRVRSAYPD
ncbi:MAG: hypothetical protein FJW90_10360 [Actinobacteria bacterium]|nr:hypothetical protein [Actinomycetota bacterium]